MEPPQYSGYNRPGQDNGVYNTGYPPGVYFEFIGTAWKMIMANVGTWVVATLIVLAPAIALSVVNNLINAVLFPGSRSSSPEQALQVFSSPLYWLVNLPLGILSNVITLCLLMGLQVLALDQFDGKPMDVGRVLAPFKQLLPLFGTNLLTGIATFVGTMLCLVPGFYLMGLLALAGNACYFLNLGTLDSFNYSRELLKPFAWRMFALMVAAIFCSLMGLVACGIGILVTYPILPIVLALQWRTFHPVQQIPQPQPQWQPTTPGR